MNPNPLGSRGDLGHDFRPDGGEHQDPRRGSRLQASVDAGLFLSAEHGLLPDTGH